MKLQLLCCGGVELSQGVKLEQGILLLSVLAASTPAQTPLHLQNTACSSST
jgi:hypothetical protein